LPFDGLARVRTLLDDAASSPVVEASARVDEPIVQPHQELCVVLNYADHARGCGVEKLVLVHRGPGLEGGESEERALEEVSAIYDGEVVLANELDVLDL
jgi:hypothetical protein